MCGAVEQSETQNSHASQSTHFPKDEQLGVPLQDGQTSSRAAVPQLASKAIATILQFLSDEEALLPQLGIRQVDS